MKIINIILFLIWINLGQVFGQDLSYFELSFRPSISASLNAQSSNGLIDSKGIFGGELMLLKSFIRNGKVKLQTGLQFGLMGSRIDLVYDRSFTPPAVNFDYGFTYINFHDHYYFGVPFALEYNLNNRQEKNWSIRGTISPMIGFANGYRLRYSVLDDDTNQLFTLFEGGISVNDKPLFLEFGIEMIKHFQIGKANFSFSAYHDFSYYKPIKGQLVLFGVTESKEVSISQRHALKGISLSFGFGKK